MLVAAQKDGKGGRDLTCAIGLAHAYDLLMRYGLVPFCSSVSATLEDEKSVCFLLLSHGQRMYAHVSSTRP
jgi:hypothetical protein